MTYTAQQLLDAVNAQIYKITVGGAEEIETAAGKDAKSRVKALSISDLFKMREKLQVEVDRVSNGSFVTAVFAPHGEIAPNDD